MKKVVSTWVVFFWGMQLCFSQTNVQSSGSVGLLAGSPPDVLRTQNGWSSHYVSGSMGGFTTIDKWQAMGEFTSGTYYGHRVQQSRLGLFSGFNNTQPVIQWERNSPFVSPPSLQFRYGSGNPTPSG